MPTRRLITVALVAGVAFGAAPSCGGHADGGLGGAAGGNQPGAGGGAGGGEVRGVAGGSGMGGVADGTGGVASGGTGGATTGGAGGDQGGAAGSADDGGEPVDGGGFDAGLDASEVDAGPIAPDGAVAGAGCDGPGARFATRVVASEFGPGQSFGRDHLPGIVLGPPRGGGADNGSIDVAALGNGGSITLAFDGNAIVDGPGADFIVFENPFAVGGNPANPFAEPATVAVSDDGVNWVAFPCSAAVYPFGSCAGWRYVYANADSNTIDATDPTVAGGDAFDLAEVGVARARFVRITDRSDLASVFDLDAVSIVNAACW